MNIVKHILSVIIYDFIDNFIDVFICAKLLYFGKPDFNGIIACCIVTAVCQCRSIKSRFSHSNRVRIEYLYMVVIFRPKRIHDNRFTVNFSARIFSRNITAVPACHKCIVILERKFKILVFFQTFIGNI